MPPLSQTVDGYNVFKGSLLPARIRPLVLIAWKVFPGGAGDAPYRQVQYFVVVPRSVVVAKEMGLSDGDLEGYGVQSIMSLDAMQKFALTRAQSYLDELANEQFSQAHPARTFYEPIALELADDHEVQAFGLAEEYGDAWSYIRDRTRVESLRSRIGMILKLRQLDCSFTDAQLVRGRMR